MSQFDHETTPTAFHPIAQGWEERPTLGVDQSRQPTLKGLHQNMQMGSNPFRVASILRRIPRVGADAPTLGYGVESRWDSSNRLRL